MKRLILMCMVLLGGISTFAKNTIVDVEQVSTEVTLTDDVDYTITSTTPFTGAGIVNIVNTDHAVVIIKNVTPSVVLANGTLSHIRINGNTATNNTNCQVRMYDRGSIIYPYGSTYTFKPLICYDKPNLEGNSSNNFTEGHSGGFMKNIGPSFNNKIRSFVLKRGYMVTFAVGQNGWGYSRCFIADHEDLEIKSLPYPLNGKITSYRIFKWWNIHKSGLASDADEIRNNALNSGWCYDWAGGNENTLPNREWVPNHIYEDWPSASSCGSRTGSCHMKTNNEPGNPADDHPQTVEEVLANWENLMRTGMRLCSESSHDGSWAHLQEFIREIDERGWRCDLLDLHCYWPASSFGDFSYYYNAYGKRPIWISEWTWGASWNNNGIFSAAPDGKDSYSIANQECMLNGTKPILDKLNASKYVERYAIWNGEAVASRVYHNGGLSLFGEYYAANTGGLGYDATIQKIPTNRPVVPTEMGLSGSYSKLTKEATLTWEDGNYERIDSFSVQVKRPGSSFFTTLGAVYPVDQNAKDNSTTATYTFTDPDAEIGPNTYKVIARYNGSNFSSNEAIVAVSSNGEIGYLRYGEAQLAGTTANDVNYAKSFEARKSPYVVLSAPTAKNNFGKFLNIQTSSVSKFSAVMTPFVKDASGELYTLTAAEAASYIALPKDSTYFEIPSIADPAISLKLQCGAAPSKVGAENVHVTFDVPFDDGVTPVVIVTAIKPTSITYGMLPRVENITNTGFDVRIERPAYYSSKAFTTVSVYYFAMEPGEASLGGGLLISAQRYEDALEKGRTYGKPVTLTTPLVKPNIVFGAQSIKHDALREVFIGNTTKKTEDGYQYTTAITPYAYLDGSATTTGTAYNPSEDLGFIAVATDPNGNPDDPPTITAVNDIVSKGASKDGAFDAWAEGNIIRCSNADVRVYTTAGLEVKLNTPLSIGLYIVSNGKTSKKINIR